MITLCQPHKPFPNGASVHEKQAVHLGGFGTLIFATLPLAWLAFGLSLCLLVAASKWLLIGRIKPGESFTTHR